MGVAGKHCKEQTLSARCRHLTGNSQLFAVRMQRGNLTLDDNKKLVKRFIEEIWNQRHLDVADEVFAADCITHQLRSGADSLTMPRPPEALKQHISEWLVAFSDIQFSIEQMITEGDRVVAHFLARGTHLGAWHSIPPTGKEISIQMMVVYRIANGQITEDWVLVDFLGFFQQLGLVKPTNELIAANSPQRE